MIPGVVIHNGFTLLGRLLTTGRAERWDVLIAAPAAVVTGGLVVFSMWAYARGPKQPSRDAAVFAAAAVLVIAYSTAAFAIAGERFLPLIARAFGF